VAPPQKGQSLPLKCLPQQAHGVSSLLFVVLMGVGDEARINTYSEFPLTMPDRSSAILAGTRTFDKGIKTLLRFATAKQGAYQVASGVTLV